MAEATGLTEAEAAVYDRQIRVWGLEVQKRLNAARVLLIDCTGLSAEVAKNIVLAGVGALSVMDDRSCAACTPGNFLVPAAADPHSSVAAASVATLAEMNPLVRVSVAPGPPRQVITNAAAPEKTLGFELEETLGFEALLGRDRETRRYDLVLIVGQPLGTLVKLDEACRERGIAFLAAASRGTTSYFFSDPGTHSFTPIGPGGKALAQREATYASLADALRPAWKGLHPKRTHKLLPVLQLCAAAEGNSGAFAPVSDAPKLEGVAAEWAAEAGVAPAILDPAMLAAFLGNSEELAPINAVIGGVLANEVLKLVSHKGEPFNNIFFFTLSDGAGVVERAVGK